MEQISFFLAKFKNLGLQEAETKHAFVIAVEHAVGVALPLESITISNGTFFVTAHPALKSELYIKRTAILQELETTLKNGAQK